MSLYCVERYNAREMNTISYQENTCLLQFMHGGKHSERSVEKMTWSTRKAPQKVYRFLLYWFKSMRLVWIFQSTIFEGLGLPQFCTINYIKHMKASNRIDRIFTYLDGCFNQGMVNGHGFKSYFKWKTFHIVHQEFLMIRCHTAGSDPIFSHVYLLVK